VSYTDACSRATHDRCDKDWCGCPCHKQVMHDAGELVTLIKTAASNDWVLRARCGSMGLGIKSTDDIFYPDVGSDKTARHSARLHRRAKRICALCPVRKECLTEALMFEAGKLEGQTWTRANPEGVWGGHTALERHAECRSGPGRHKCPRKVQEHAQRLERKFMGEITKYLTPDERKAG
jgi:hypothetical protein